MSLFEQTVDFCNLAVSVLDNAHLLSNVAKSWIISGKEQIAAGNFFFLGSVVEFDRSNFNFAFLSVPYSCFVL